MDAPQVYRTQPDLEVVPADQQKGHVGDYYSDAAQHPSSGVERRGRTVCGLRPTTFCLTLALLCVIIVAAIGGGVGGTIAVHNAKNANNNIASATATATTTVTVTASSTSPSSTSAFVTVPTTGTLELNCPAIDNSNLRITLGTQTWLYTLTCGADFASVNGRQQDILALTAYSLHDCAQACSSYNHNYGSNACKGATFNKQLYSSVQANWGTCFLKNYTDGKVQSASNDFVGMVLQ